MCGIVAVLTGKSPPVELELLRSMARTMDHRGPDDEGHAQLNGAGFFHKRLSIIDIAGGHQPMSRNGLTIIFNGAIYNYVELRDGLRQRGHQFRTQSDTEVILALYEEHGEEAIRHLNGMFAFVLYDDRRQTVVAARDHFGIKPLYYHRSPRHLAFASEIKALLVHPDISAVADREALADYISFQFCIGDATLFQGIRCVRPGHYQVIDLQSLSVREECYWRPEFSIDTDHSEEYFAERIRDLLDDSVRLQVRSDVSVGAHLSGGIDSSLITLLASRHVTGRLRTFTGAFDDGSDFDETPYADEVAAACDAEQFRVYPTAREFVDLLPRLIHLLDQPAAGPGVFPQYMVSRLAAQHVKVVLGGQGGDEVFGGYVRYLLAYFEQALKGAVFETNEESEHVVSLSSILPNLPVLQQYIPMMQQFWRGGLFEPMSQRYFRLIDRSPGAEHLLCRDFQSLADRNVQLERFREIFDYPETLSYYSRMTHFDLVTSLPALLHVEDRVSMGCSLESRVPFLDPRIVDVVTSMPPRMKFRGGELKYILKRAVGSILPPRVLARKDKMGFPVPLDSWVAGPAREFVHDVLGSSACRSRGIFDSGEMQQLLNGHHEPRFGRRLWGLLNVELWHQQFIDAD